MHTATTNGAEFQWTRVPRGKLVLVLPDGRQEVFGEELSTEQAARVLGITKRNVQWKCVSGVLREGVDWRRVRVNSTNGRIWIRRDAVMRLRG